MKKEKRLLRLIVTLCMTIVLLTAFCAQSFAAESKGWMATGNDINGETGELIVPNGVRTVTPHVLDRVLSYTVEKVTIPNSVKVIETGAFSDAKKLKVVEIDNCEGGIKIEENAILATAEIVYLREKPTAPPTTTTTRRAPAYNNDNTQSMVGSTAAPTQSTTAAPVPPTMNKKSTTTTKKSETTTAKEETTTQETTTVKVTESTPFSDAKSQLEDVEVWDKIINQTTEQATAPKQKSTSGFAKGASYAAVAVVAVSAIGLGVLKFKK